MFPCWGTGPSPYQWWFFYKWFEATLQKTSKDHEGGTLCDNMKMHSSSWVDFKRVDQVYPPLSLLIFIVVWWITSIFVATGVKQSCPPFHGPPVWSSLRIGWRFSGARLAKVLEISGCAIESGIWITTMVLISTIGMSLIRSALDTRSRSLTNFNSINLYQFIDMYGIDMYGFSLIPPKMVSSLKSETADLAGA